MKWDIIKNKKKMMQEQAIIKVDRKRCIEWWLKNIELIGFFKAIYE